jgi:hypothetical protein
VMEAGQCQSVDVGSDGGWDSVYQEMWVVTEAGPVSIRRCG